MGRHWGVVLVALAIGSRREINSLVVLIVLVLLLPAFMELPKATSEGLVWKGRYTFPLLVGIPLIGTAIIGGICLAPGSLSKAHLGDIGDRTAARQSSCILRSVTAVFHRRVGAAHSMEGRLAAARGHARGPDLVCDRHHAIFDFALENVLHSPFTGSASP